MTRLILILFVTCCISNVNLNAQNREYEICKHDSSSSNIFIYTTREYASNLSNVTQLIKEIETEYYHIDNLSILFFDDIENCGYKIEVTEINNDSVDIKTNNIWKHWFADYSRENGRIKYFKNDETLQDSVEYVIKK